MKTRLTTANADLFPELGFRAMLQDELAARCASNTQYSLRAFALDLQTDHSTLSQILRGKRRLTNSMIERLSKALGLSSQAIAAYQSREKMTSNRSDARVIEAERLTDYAARVVTDWEHFAILELTRLKAFLPDVRWIARVLGITPDEVTVAMNRLLYLGMMQMTPEGKWRDLSGDTVVGVEDYAAATIKQLMTKVGSLICERADRHPTAMQDHSATTIAVDVKKIPQAIERIQAFRRELIEVLDEGGARDAVYRFDVHLYPLTITKGEDDGKPGHTLASDNEQT